MAINDQDILKSISRLEKYKYLVKISGIYYHFK